MSALGILGFLFCFFSSDVPGEDRYEIGEFSSGLQNQGVASYISVKSRFYGYDAAVDRDTTQGLPAYDYTPHLIFDQYNGIYRLITGGRWRDVDVTDGDGTITHDGDHSLPYIASPVNSSSSVDSFRGALSFTSAAVSRFSGMTTPGPVYTWGTQESTDSYNSGDVRWDTNTWWVSNTLEPEFFRFFDRFYLMDQVMIWEGSAIDYWESGHERAEAKADRIQLHSAPVTNGFNFNRVLIENPGYSHHRGVVTHMDQPHITKLTHHMVMVVPDDPDGKIFWLYPAVFINNQYTGYVRIRSDDFYDFDWRERETVTGMSGLGNQLGYVYLENGTQVFVAMSTTPRADGHTAPSLSFSIDGLSYEPCDSLTVVSGLHAAASDNRISLASCSLTNNPDNQNVYFMGFSTIDGWGELESLGDDIFRAYYVCTTANSPVAPDIFDAEIGLGEMIFQISASSNGFDWSQAEIDVDNDSTPNLADFDADNDGAENDWERFLGRDPYKLTDAGVSFEFDANYEGWTTDTAVNVSITNGVLKMTGNNAAKVESPEMGFTGSKLSRMHVRLKCSHQSWAQLHWQTPAAPSYDASRVINLALPSQVVSGQTWVQFATGGHAEWAPRHITRVRLIPCLKTGAVSEVDEIIFSDGDWDDDGISDDVEGYGDSDADGIPDFMDDE